MPLVKCPNCGHEFIIGEEVYGNCPVCGIALFFKDEDEVVEIVNIREIEEKIDRMEERGEKIVPDINEIITEILEKDKNYEYIERKVDELTG